MKKTVAVAMLAPLLGLGLGLGLAALAAAPAFAQQAAAPDPAAMKIGGILYSADCSQCHQAAGVGTPPDFPALAGNAHLSSLNLIAGNIHNGKGNMPPFANLNPTQIAALATYIRNSWGNSFGGVAAADVTAVLGTGSSSAATTSIWTGVFTTAQSARGAAVYSGACSRCHGPQLNGAGAPDMPPSPAVARTSFLHKWQGQSVAALFTYVKTKMPQDNPGTLTDPQYADVIAYMFAQSNIPAGSKELAADPKALGGLSIEENGP